MLHKFSTWILFASSLPVNSCSYLSLLTFSFSSLFTYKQIGLIQSATKTERYDQKILMLSNTWKRLQKKVPKVNTFLNATTMTTPFLARFSAKKIRGLHKCIARFPTKKIHSPPHPRLADTWFPSLPPKSVRAGVRWRHNQNFSDVCRLAYKWAQIFFTGAKRER